MLDTFLATLSPMLTLFLCILIGFLLKKFNILSDEAGKAMAKLETWIFCPALSFCTMARFFTIKTLSFHATNIIFSTIGVTIAMAIAIPLSSFFIKDKSYEKGVYQYAIAFANMGYVGDPLVLALFGEEVLSYYKVACLPYSLVIYTWGISVLLPHKEDKGTPLKKIFNAPTIAMFIGIAVGLICGAFVENVPINSTAFDELFPSFLIDAFDSLKACMGPVAMLLAGFTIARYDFKTMLQNKKVYVVTALRLTVIPIVSLALLFGIKELGNLVFHLSIDNTPLLLIFFAISCPLGLNTIVFPESYGGDSKTGASMAMISHTLCVLTIPIMFAIVSAVLGGTTYLPL